MGWRGSVRWAGAALAAILLLWEAPAGAAGGFDGGGGTTGGNGLRVRGSAGQGLTTGIARRGGLSVSPGLLALPAARVVPPGDFDGDGSVGFSDFLVFASGFGHSAGQPGFDPRLDLDGDETVGFSDFLRFAALFGRG